MDITKKAEDQSSEPDPLIVVGAFIKDPSNAQVISAIATVAIFLSGIVFGIVSYLQWQTSKEAAAAALISAGAVNPRLAIALLTPEPLTAEGLPIDQNRLHVSFRVPNYGPTAAQEARICEFDYLDKEPVGRRPYSNCKSSAFWGYGSPVIPPVTALNGTQAPGWGMDGTVAITSDDLVRLRDGKLQAVFSILASYEDAARQTHHSEGCIVFTMNPKWGSQSIGNWGSSLCPWTMQND